MFCAKIRDIYGIYATQPKLGTEGMIILYHFNYSYLEKVIKTGTILTLLLYFFILFINLIFPFWILYIEKLILLLINIVLAK